MSAHPGLIALALCLVAALVLIVVGALRLARAGLQLKKRVAGYGDLPLKADIARAQARLSVAERQAGTVPALLARARAAVVRIEAARARFVFLFKSVQVALRLAGWYLKP